MHEGTTVLLVVINGDGTLKSVVQLKSSGMPKHDFETIAAVRQSFPFRPPSKVLLNEEGRMVIRFSFHYVVRPIL
jgi:TonB family protein